MGIHISVMNEAGKEHPEWNCGRMAGDSDIPFLTGWIPHRLFWLDETSAIWFPLDPNALWAVKWPEENPDRWALLRRLLHDGEFGIYLSY